MQQSPFIRVTVLTNELSTGMVYAGSQLPQTYTPYPGYTPPPATNLFNPAMTVSGFVASGGDNFCHLDSTDIHNGGSYDCSDFIPIPLGQSFITNMDLCSWGGSCGYAFYDYNKSYITGGQSPPYTAIGPVGNQAYVRITVLTNEIATGVVYLGNQLPQTYQPFPGYVQPQGGSTNLFDPNAVTVNGFVDSGGNNTCHVDTTDTHNGAHIDCSDFMPIPPGQPFITNMDLCSWGGTCGYAFYDSNKSYLSGATSIPRYSDRSSG